MTDLNNLELKITASTNVTTVDFLDVTFALKKKTYKPFLKPGNTHLYVNTKSNHPPVIAKRIPHAIQTRLSNISSDHEIFNNSKHVYEKALQEAGHHTDLKYTPKHENNNSRQHQRKRRITWFNPPFSQHVKTNIGKKFLNLIDKKTSQKRMSCIRSATGIH